MDELDDTGVGLLTNCLRRDSQSMCVSLCVRGSTGDKISEDVEAKVRQSESFGRWVVIKDGGDMEERRQRKQKREIQIKYVSIKTNPSPCLQPAPY